MFKIKNIFKRKKVSPIKLLPQSVLYALSYEEGLLNKRHLISLINSGFWRESFYLYLRLVSITLNPKEMAHILKMLIAEILKGPNFIKKALIDQIELLSDKTTLGVKLAQLSRQGFDYWYDLYENHVNSYLKNKIVPTIIAYAPLIGIASFVKLHRFNLLDIRLLDSDSKIIGYKIFIYNKEDIRIDFIKRNDNLTGTVLDDTMKTGSKFEKVREHAALHSWVFNFHCMCSV